MSYTFVIRDVTVNYPMVPIISYMTQPNSHGSGAGGRLLHDTGVPWHWRPIAQGDHWGLNWGYYHFHPQPTGWVETSPLLRMNNQRKQRKIAIFFWTTKDWPWFCLKDKHPKSTYWRHSASLATGRSGLLGQQRWSHAWEDKARMLWGITFLGAPWFL